MSEAPQSPRGLAGSQQSVGSHRSVSSVDHAQRIKDTLEKVDVKSFDADTSDPQDFERKMELMSPRRKTPGSPTRGSFDSPTRHTPAGHSVDTSSETFQNASRVVLDVKKLRKNFFESFYRIFS